MLEGWTVDCGPVVVVVVVVVVLVVLWCSGAKVSMVLCCGPVVVCRAAADWPWQLTSNAIQSSPPSLTLPYLLL